MEITAALDQERYYRDACLACLTAEVSSLEAESRAGAGVAARHERAAIELARSLAATRSEARQLAAQLERLRAESAAECAAENARLSGEGGEGSSLEQVLLEELGCERMRRVEAEGVARAAAAQANAAERLLVINGSPHLKGEHKAPNGSPRRGNELYEESAAVLAPLDVGDGDAATTVAASANGGEYGGRINATLRQIDEASDDESLRSPSPPTSPDSHAHKASRIPKPSPSPSTTPESAQAMPEGASGTPPDEHAKQLGLRRRYLIEATRGLRDATSRYQAAVTRHMSVQGRRGAQSAPATPYGRAPGLQPGFVISQ